MADSKISALTSYSNPDPANDVLPIVDTTNTTTKKISRNNLLGITSTPVGINDSQTLTSKILTAPTINGATLSGTLSGTYTIGGTPTFPASVVTLTGSQTLTNKILTSPTINAPTITNASMTIDAITGFSSANTGSVYGMAVTSSKVSGASITNSTVTPDKLNLGPQTNYIATDETTTSTVYAALTTPQSVTITIGANGLALVHFSAGLYNVAVAKRLSVAVSGANTIAASDNWSIRNDNSAFVGLQHMTHLFTGLAAGSTTFSLQYATVSGTAHAFERRITAIPL